MDIEKRKQEKRRANFDTMHQGTQFKLDRTLRLKQKQKLREFVAWLERCFEDMKGVGVDGAVEKGASVEGKAVEDDWEIEEGMGVENDWQIDSMETKDERVQNEEHEDAWVSLNKNGQKWRLRLTDNELGCSEAKFHAPRSSTFDTRAIL